MSWHPAILLRSWTCADSVPVMVAVPRSVLVTQSRVFQAMLSDKWNCSHIVKSDGKSTEVHDSSAGTDFYDPLPEETSVYDTIEGTEDEKRICRESGHDDDDDTDLDSEENCSVLDNLASIVDVKGFNSLSVKILFEFIQGYKSMMEENLDVEILTDIIRLCDFYDMPQYVEVAATKLDHAEITMASLMTVMEIVEKYEAIHVFQPSATKLEEKCVSLFVQNMNRTEKVVDFVMEHAGSFSIVVRLCRKAKSQIHDQSVIIDLKNKEIGKLEFMLSEKESELERNLSNKKSQLEKEYERKIASKLEDLERESEMQLKSKLSQMEKEFDRKIASEVETLERESERRLSSEKFQLEQMYNKKILSKVGDLETEAFRRMKEKKDVLCLYCRSERELHCVKCRNVCHFYCSKKHS